jgi:hypothetical protein
MFWVIAKNEKNPKKSQNEFQWTTKFFLARLVLAHVAYI